MKTHSSAQNPIKLQINELIQKIYSVCNVYNIINIESLDVIFIHAVIDPFVGPMSQ